MISISKFTKDLPQQTIFNAVKGKPSIDFPSSFLCSSFFFVISSDISIHFFVTIPRCLSSSLVFTDDISLSLSFISLPSTYIKRLFSVHLAGIQGVWCLPSPSLNKIIGNHSISLILSQQSPISGLDEIHFW